MPAMPDVLAEALGMADVPIPGMPEDEAVGEVELEQAAAAAVRVTIVTATLCRQGTRMVCIGEAAFVGVRAGVRRIGNGWFGSLGKR
jgi:hypothetical protein